MRGTAGRQAQESLDVAEIVTGRVAIGLELQGCHQSRLVVQQLLVHLSLMSLEIAAGRVRRIAYDAEYLRVFMAVAVDCQRVARWK